MTKGINTSAVEKDKYSNVRIFVFRVWRWHPLGLIFFPHQKLTQASCLSLCQMPHLSVTAAASLSHWWGLKFGHCLCNLIKYCYRVSHMLIQEVLKLKCEINVIELWVHLISAKRTKRGCDTSVPAFPWPVASFWAPTSLSETRGPVLRAVLRRSVANQIFQQLISVMWKMCVFLSLHETEFFSARVQFS